jgi:transposase
MSIKKNHKPEFKFQVVLEYLKGRTQTELSRQYDINQQLITNWKKQLLEKAPLIFSSSAKNQNKTKEKKVEELEKIIGRQTIEIQFLKKVLGHLG